MATINSRDRIFEELVILLPTLKAFARRFEREPDAVEDLVQESVMRAIAGIDKFEEGTRLKSWLFTIIRNTFCTRYSIRKREPLGFQECVSSQRSTEPEQEWAYHLLEFEAAFKELPWHYRTAMEAVLLQGQSYEDAAKYCGCPIGTLKSRVNRGRSILASRIGDEPPALKKATA